MHTCCVFRYAMQAICGTFMSVHAALFSSELPLSVLIGSLTVQGVTPLHIAVQTGCTKLAAVLLEHGAPVTFGHDSACKVRHAAFLSDCLLCVL